MAVRSSAARNLVIIKNPKALSAVDRALAGGFPKEEKFKILTALGQQNTPEAFQVILKYWFLEKWPKEAMSMPPKMLLRKDWPEELGDPRMWALTKTLGKKESLPLFISAWPGIVETTDILIPNDRRDYIFYYNL